MRKHKLVVCMIGQDCERTLRLSLDSIKDVANSIIFVDGGSKDSTLDILDEYGFKSYKDLSVTPNSHVWRMYANKLVNRPFEHAHPGAIGRARGAYLHFLKRDYQGWWVLVLDPDEIVEKPEKIREYINAVKREKPSVSQYIINLPMEHLIGDIAHVDRTEAEHICKGRLFNISDDKLYYPETEHALVHHPDVDSFLFFRNMQGSCKLWHLAYCSGMFDIRKRYLNHITKSELKTHTPDYLHNWYFAHVLGQYPVQEIGVSNLPPILREFFLPGDLQDYMYFSNRRTVEQKHFIMLKQWLSICEKGITQEYKHTILDLGAGTGPFGFVAYYLEKNYLGIEKSNYAVQNTLYKGINLQQGDITDTKHCNKLIDKFFGKDIIPRKEFDLVIFSDILEHLTYDQLDKVLSDYSGIGKKFIFSIPFIGDPNLELDPTHLIKEPKEWWINKLSQYFTITDAPDGWLFHKQLLIGEPRNGKQKIL